jgi:Arc/MetJ family transcription regulator
LKTKRDAVNLALRSLARDVEPMTVEEVRAMWGTGWDGDLDEMRNDRVDPL